jgi:hypothetical protein
MQVRPRGSARRAGSTDNLFPFYNIPLNNVKFIQMKVQGDDAVTMVFFPLLFAQVQQWEGSPSLTEGSAPGGDMFRQR